MATAACEALERLLSVKGFRPILARLRSRQFFQRLSIDAHNRNARNLPSGVVSPLGLVSGSPSAPLRERRPAIFAAGPFGSNEVRDVGRHRITANRQVVKAPVERTRPSG